MNKPIYVIAALSCLPITSALATQELAPYSLGPYFSNAQIANDLPGLQISAKKGRDAAPAQWVSGIPLSMSDSIGVTLNDITLNMDSHHLQNKYSEWGLIIPEFVESVTWSTTAQAQNVGTIAQAKVKYVDDIPTSFAKLSAGDLGQTRVIGGAAFDVWQGKLLYGIDYSFYDGPWEQPEDFQRFNGFLRYHKGQTALGLYSYNANWFNSPLIPERQVSTDRYQSFSLTDEQVSKRMALTASTTFDFEYGKIQTSGMWSDSSITQFENVTFALNDPANGDQQLNTDERVQYQISTRYDANALAIRETQHELSASVTYQNSDIIGSHGNAIDGIETTTIREDEHKRAQLSTSLIAGSQWLPEWSSVLRMTANQVTDEITNASDKLNITAIDYYAELIHPYNEVILTAAFSHQNIIGDAHILDTSSTNDSTITTIDSASLSGQYSWPNTTINSTITVWGKWFDDALYYHSPTATTIGIPNQKTYGITSYLSIKPNTYSFFDVDITYQVGKYDTSTNNDSLPHFPRFMATSRFGLEFPNKIQAYARLTHLGSYSTTGADEDNIESATILSASVSMPLSQKVRLGLEGFNLFNFEETSYADYYASRLPGEASATEENHIKPVAPASFRATLWLEW